MAAALNPYDYGRPVTDQASFAGRLKLLEKVDYTIDLATSERPQYRNLAITGARGIGKTSLLNQIAYMGGISGLLAARIELNNELASNQAALFHQILDDVAAKLQDSQRLGGIRGRLQRIFGRTSVEVELNLFIGQLKAARKDATDVPQEALRKSLRDAFRGAKRAGKKGIMVCIDEADLLAKDETVLQALRNTFQQEEGYILVIAGREDLLANLGKVFGPMQRFFDQVALGPFENASEVLDCLQGPLETDERGIVTDQFAADVHEMTGGLPYHVKLMAFHAYRTMQLEGWKRLRLSEDIVNEALQGVRTSETSEAVAERLARRLAEPFEVDETDRVTVLADLEAEEKEEKGPAAYDMAGLDGGESPVIKFVNRTLEQAVLQGATQIQFMPDPEHLVVRMRIDGVMSEAANAPKGMHKSVASRLKIMANLDISEQRLPQDGVIRVRIGTREIQGHVLTSPTLHGESIVVQIREMNRDEPVVALDATGLQPQELQTIDAAGLGQAGLVVVASPGNDGKTTTLYGLLGRAMAPQKYAATVEEEIAGPIRGATQHRTRSRVGLTMPVLLRSVVSQDPDLLLVDPVRDADTANALVEATSAGRAVLCGVYADDALAGLTTLLEFGMDPGLLARSLRVVISQKLVRRMCENCKAQEPRGCAACNNTGFKGRVGVFQILVIDDKMRNALHANAPQAELRRLADLRPLRDLALDKVREGVTTAEEVARVFR